MTKKLLFCMLAIMAITAKAQYKTTLINLDTVVYYGTTDTADYAPIQVNIDGKVILSGNQKVNATQYDATTAAQTANATVAWVNSFNPSNQKCFVTASTHDDAGYIYNVGAVRIATLATGLDFFVSKLSASGSLVWTKYYNGSASGTDVASAVAVDNITGNVYVTGAVTNVFPDFMDMVTICYDQNGNQMWATPYDYANSIDVPTAIDILDATNLVVSGFSGSSITNNDFCTVQYDLNSGTQTDVSRTSNTNAGAQDVVFSMAADTLGNVYRVGTTLNGSNYDLQVQMLDTALNVLWTQTFDAYGFDDGGINLDLDDSLNIYVTGYSYNTATTKQSTVLKYANNGTFRWAITPLYATGLTSEGVRIKVKSGNEIFVGGNVTQNGNQDAFIMRVNRDGQKTLQKSYNGPANNTDKFMDFTLDNSEHIFVSARSYSAGLDNNIIIQYHYWDKPLIVDTNTVTGVQHVQEELIIGFNPSVLKMNKIDNTGITFGDLSDFVADSACDAISAFLDPERYYGISAKTLKAQKIFVSAVSADSLSESRMGDYVKVPPFYAKLLVSLPSSIMNTDSAAANLPLVAPHVITSQMNYIYELFWTPNDSLYAVGEYNLHPTTTYTNAHINCVKAWDYTKGKSFVRLGVYDTGCEQYHLDLSVGVTRDYINQSGTGDDVAGHGSKVASIACARSSNTIGMTGIAGGDYSVSGFVTYDGVKLANVKVFTGTTFASTASLIAAYKEGADGVNINGLALHVTNHSYGQINNTIDAAVKEGINYMNQNGVAFVAARGNAGVAGQNYPPSQYSSPACVLPGKVMNVGASGTDGHYHVSGVNGSLFTSMSGKGVDFLAPGFAVPTIMPFHVEPRPAKTSSLASTYTTTSGTSASAPHVAGVIGLMMSDRNSPTPSWDNIVHEDCEALLKRTATDLSLSGSPYFETAGYDTTSGYGRINADSALSAIQPQYKIRHIDKNHYSNSTNTSTTMVASNVNVYCPTLPNSNVLAGQYQVNILEVKTTYGYSYSGETYVDSWPLYKASVGNEGVYPGSVPQIITDDPNYVALVSANLTSATLTTRVYYIMYNSISQVTVNTWYPSPPGSVKSALTLYTIGDPDIATQILHKEAQVEYFNVYPNPSTGNFTMGFSSKKECNAFVLVTDLMGRAVYQNPNLHVRYGLNRSDLALTYLPKGIYLLNLEIENNRSMVKKLIIE